MANILTSFGQGSDFGHKDYTEARKAGFSNEDIIKWMQANPEKLIGKNVEGGGGLYDEILSEGRGRDSKESDLSQVNTSYGWEGNPNTFDPDAAYRIKRDTEKLKKSPVVPITDIMESPFWDEVEAITPPDETRNAGDIAEIISEVGKLRKDPDQPIDLNINSNEVLTDQTNDWVTAISNIGDNATVEAPVTNTNVGINRNSFIPDGDSLSPSTSADININDMDTTQRNKWVTSVSDIGDGATIYSPVTNTNLGINDNSFRDNPLILEDDDKIEIDFTMPDTFISRNNYSDDVEPQDETYLDKYKRQLLENLFR